jgi:hypothetical protein
LNGRADAAAGASAAADAGAGGAEVVGGAGGVAASSADAGIQRRRPRHHGLGRRSGRRHRHRAIADRRRLAAVQRTRRQRTGRLPGFAAALGPARLLLLLLALLLRLLRLLRLLGRRLARQAVGLESDPGAALDDAER